MSRLAGVAAGIVVVVFLAGAIKWFLPSLTLERQTVASTPSLQGLSIRSEVLLRRESRACIAPVPLDRDVREVQMLLNARSSVPPLLDVTLRGPGYDASTRLAGQVTKSDQLSTGRLSSAPPAAGDGELCLVNRGRHTVALVGTSEPESLTRPATTVDGKPLPDIDPALTFLTGERRDILSEAGTVIDRATGFTDVVPAWLLWPLAILFFAGIPAGAAAVFLLSRES
jgi:hypothetical protein